MLTEDECHAIISFQTKYETNLKKFAIANEKTEKEEECTAESLDFEAFKVLFSSDRITYKAFEDTEIVVANPRIAVWDFLEQDELKSFLNLSRKSDIKKAIGNKLGNFPRGKARTMVSELLYNARKYCKQWKFNLEQSGALLSQFFLTHQYFTSSVDVSAEKIYFYFKEFTINHSLPFPPERIKLFSQTEAKDILTFFCKIYIKNLPLIRFLCLPNYAFELNCEIEPDPPILKKKAPPLAKGSKR